MTSISALSFSTMIDEKSIWMLFIKEIDSDSSFLLFWSFLFFILVVSCACIWQLVTVFILLSSFCSSRCLLRLSSFVFRSAQLFLIYICHSLSVFDEEEKNRIAVLWWCRDERIDIFKWSKNQQWQDFEESWIWYKNKLWSHVTFLTWMSLRARFCWFDKILKTFAENIFREINMKKKTLTLVLVIWEQQSISWKISYVIVSSNERKRLCILCFRNERILMSIESDDLTRFLLKYQSLFTSYEFLFSQFIHISSCAYSDDYFNTFRSNCEKNSNSLSSDVFVIFWQWIILSL